MTTQPKPTTAEIPPPDRPETLWVKAEIPPKSCEQRASWDRFINRLVVLAKTGGK